MPSKSPCKPSQSSGLLLHGFPVTPHPFANIIFCYFKHLPTCPGRTAGRLLLGSLELIPRQELSSLPRSPGAQSCLSYLWAGGGGGPQAALVTQAQPTKHLTFCFQSKMSVKKRASCHPTPLLQLVKGFPGVESHPTALGPWGTAPAAPIS